MDRRTEPETPASMKVEPTSDKREILFTRILGAPRARVFRAWIDPQQLAGWWGPRGFSNPVCHTDARPGGAYRIVMRSPDGADYPLKGTYLEIAKPERLIMTVDLHEHPREWKEMLNAYRRDFVEGGSAPEMTWTVTFQDVDGKTSLAILTRFSSVAERDAMLRMGMVDGWAQSLERLEEQLAAQSDVPGAD